MSLARWIALVAGGALCVGACAPVRPPSSASPTVEPAAWAGSNDFVVVASANGLAGLDWSAGRITYEAPHAVPTLDWSRLLVSQSEPSGDRTRLDLLDARTGLRQTSIDIPGGLVATAASLDGHLVALAPEREASNWQPVGRSETRIVVADPSGVGQSRTFDLSGNYEPDAFSSDNRSLFVLDYLPPEAPDRYRVRQLDLATGLVSGIGSRSKVAVPEEDMRGTRQTHVLSPDRQTLYTLYTNQPDYLHSRDLAAGRTQSSGDVYAFVHVLNLLEGWAYCLDLPRPLGEGPASAHTIALSPDGRSLYVADRSSGTVAVADTDQLMVRKVANVGADPQAARASAAVGSDGSLFLSGASELVVVDARTMAVTRRLPLPGAPTGLGLSLDGQRLFVGLQDRVVALDPLSGARLAELAAAGTQRIEHIGRL